MSKFFVVAKERGSFKDDLPAWASKVPNPTSLDEFAKSEVKRVDLDELPGGFQLLNVLSKQECENIIKEANTLGFTQDAAVSLPRNIRHNDNLVWVVDDKTHDIIWNRVKEFMYDNDNIYEGKKALSINKRFRFYKYDKEDFFKLHSDGSWPGSAVINDTLVMDAHFDRYSQMTFLILLSEDFKGGETQFLVDINNPNIPARDVLNAKKVNIRTPAGAVLCFPHGLHPLHCLHSSEKILEGVKYIIRTDVLFEK